MALAERSRQRAGAQFRVHRHCTLSGLKCTSSFGRVDCRYCRNPLRYDLAQPEEDGKEELEKANARIAELEHMVESYASISVIIEAARKLKSEKEQETQKQEETKKDG